MPAIFNNIDWREPVPPPGYIPGVSRGEKGFRTNIEHSNYVEPARRNAPAVVEAVQANRIMDEIEAHAREERHQDRAAKRNRSEATTNRPVEALSSSGSGIAAKAPTPSEHLSRFSEDTQAMKALTVEDWESINMVADRSLKYREEEARREAERRVAQPIASALGSTRQESALATALARETAQADVSTGDAHAAADGGIVGVDGGALVMAGAKEMQQRRLVRDPFDASAYVALARIYAAEGQTNAALRCITEGCRKIESDAELWLEALNFAHDEPSRRALLADATKHLANVQVPAPPTVGDTKSPHARAAHAVEAVWLAHIRHQVLGSAKLDAARSAVMSAPWSGALWEVLIEEEDDRDAIRPMLKAAVKASPKVASLWIRLAAEEGGDNGRALLALGRTHCPESIELAQEQLRYEVASPSVTVPELVAFVSTLLASLRDHRSANAAYQSEADLRSWLPALSHMLTTAAAVTVPASSGDGASALPAVLCLAWPRRTDAVETVVATTTKAVVATAKVVLEVSGLAREVLQASGAGADALLQQQQPVRLLAALVAGDIHASTSGPDEADSSVTPSEVSLALRSERRTGSSAVGLVLSAVALLGLNNLARLEFVKEDEEPVTSGFVEQTLVAPLYAQLARELHRAVEDGASIAETIAARLRPASALYLAHCLRCRVGSDAKLVRVVASTLDADLIGSRAVMLSPTMMVVAQRFRALGLAPGAVVADSHVQAPAAAAAAAAAALLTAWDAACAAPPRPDGVALAQRAVQQAQQQLLPTAWAVLAKALALSSASALADKAALLATVAPLTRPPAGVPDGSTLTLWQAPHALATLACHVVAGPVLLDVTGALTLLDRGLSNLSAPAATQTEMDRYGAASVLHHARLQVLQRLESPVEVATAADRAHRSLLTRMAAAAGHKPGSGRANGAAFSPLQLGPSAMSPSHAAILALTIDLEPAATRPRKAKFVLDEFKAAGIEAPPLVRLAIARVYEASGKGPVAQQRRRDALQACVATVSPNVVAQSPDVLAALLKGAPETERHAVRDEVKAHVSALGAMPERLEAVLSFADWPRSRMAALGACGADDLLNFVAERAGVAVLAD